MISLSEEDRKLLTEFLGECWHEIDDVPKDRFGMAYCPKCNTTFSAVHTSDWNIKAFYRTFLTYQDLGDLFTELQKRGWWEEFYHFAMKAYKGSFSLNWKYVLEHEVSAWLFRPERIGLICEFVRGKLNG